MRLRYERVSTLLAASLWGFLFALPGDAQQPVQLMVAFPDILKEDFDRLQTGAWRLEAIVQSATDELAEELPKVDATARYGRLLAWKLSRADSPFQIRLKITDNNPDYMLDVALLNTEQGASPVPIATQSPWCLYGSSWLTPKCKLKKWLTHGAMSDSAIASDLEQSLKWVFDQRNHELMGHLAYGLETHVPIDQKVEWWDGRTYEPVPRADRHRLAVTNLGVSQFGFLVNSPEPFTPYIRCRGGQGGQELRGEWSPPVTVKELGARSSRQVLGVRVEGDAVPQCRNGFERRELFLQPYPATTRVAQP